MGLLAKRFRPGIYAGLRGKVHDSLSPVYGASWRLALAGFRHTHWLKPNREKPRERGSELNHRPDNPP
jgi:hypothetical protein